MGQVLKHDHYPDQVSKFSDRFCDPRQVQLSLSSIPIEIFVETGLEFFGTVFGVLV